MTISSDQIADKTSELPGSLLQNGAAGGQGVVPGGSPPGWVVWLPVGQASLAVLAWHFSSAAENLDRAA